MREFFKGWRRKIGGAALVMALVLIAGWLRSLVEIDVLQFPSGRLTMEHCVSVDQCLVWGRLRKDNPREIIKFPVWSTSNYRSLDAFLERANLRSVYRRAGFRAGELNVDAARSRHTFWIIPYWSVSMPMLLLSTCLILWKPQKKPPT